MANLVSPSPTLQALLLTAEQRGQLSAEGWQALREVLLASTDPIISNATEQLRAFISARAAISETHRQFLAAIPAFAEQDASNLAALEAENNRLLLLLDELAARIDQLKQLHT